MFFMLSMYLNWAEQRLDSTFYMLLGHENAIQINDQANSRD
jgi:hypothetical protein